MGLLAANDGPRHLAGVSPAVTSNRGGVRSELARVDGSTRQGHERIARARAHLGGPTGGAGVAGVRRSGTRGGCRSSGLSGFGTRVHGRGNGWWTWPSGELLSTGLRSDASYAS